MPDLNATVVEIEGRKILDDIEGAFARVEAHIKNLLDNGAPHQQPLAKDIQTVLTTVSGARPAPAPDLQPALDEAKAKIVSLEEVLADNNAKLANLQSSVDSLIDERDTLKARLDEANNKMAAMLTPLSAAAEPVGGRVASQDPVNEQIGAQAAEDVTKT